MTRARALVATTALALAATTASVAPIPWEDMTEADWIYTLATRFSLVEGREVHYPTPTVELARLLEEHADVIAARYLADARLALGDHDEAVAAIEQWAQIQGGEAWEETARWAADHHLWPLAFRAADRALPELDEVRRRALADATVEWSDAHPDVADPMVQRERRARLFSDDAAAVEDWLRALEQAGRLPELDEALRATRVLGDERRLLLRSDLAADHGNDREALAILDAGVEQEWSIDVRRAFAHRVDRGDAQAPERWRALLDQRFDRGAALRLHTYFQGSDRGGDALDLLRQLELRHESRFTRADWLCVARLYGEIDAVPEAFRARLAAAHAGTAAEHGADLAELARLALRAGARPLAWGSTNDEPYRWIARVDRSPGIWTGGLSFLLTGEDWGTALSGLESQSLAQRTFATARALVDELARRDPHDTEIPALRLAIMGRHVERGEAREALALLPALETGPKTVADQARAVALLAARQTEIPLAEELRLIRARLALAAPDGSRPTLDRNYVSFSVGDDGSNAYGYGYGSSEPPRNAWARVPRAPRTQTYGDLLEEAVARLDERQPSHAASVDLLLAEMDRLPNAEALWLDLADRLTRWRLDDDLGPRYERALAHFTGPSWWARLARWYARRSRGAELRRLAEDLAQRFRGAAIFERTAQTDPDLPIPEQPSQDGVRMVRWADWVRLKALERFPHSPLVFRQAQGRLLRQSTWNEVVRDGRTHVNDDRHRVVAPDELLDQRGAALLFVDDDARESFFAEHMRRGTLSGSLETLESRSQRTPVDDRLLAEGWSRLSHFERAAPAADRLAEAYPGDGALAHAALTLHRSLAALDPSHAAPARTAVARTTRALLDPNTLWTELGELEQEAGRPDQALDTWTHLLDREPRNPQRVEELATLQWDYGHMREALDTIEAARTRLDQPQLLSFEAGVLREELHDVDGAVREYLGAATPQEDECFCSWFEHDQRALRRLSQLMAHESVLRRVEARIVGLTPGERKDEEALMALFPLATIRTPTPGLDWDVDDWIDGMDMPNDPIGRAQREARRAAGRGAEHEGIESVGDSLLEKAQAMLRASSSDAFIDAVDRVASPLVEERWSRDARVTFRDTLLARRAALAATEEERVRREVERAGFLAREGDTIAADALWTRLAERIEALPDGASRISAEVERAAYVERTQGATRADAVWSDLSRRYPWSRGILDDHVAFLDRHGRGAEARALLEASAERAADGHREQILERLTQDALAAGDLGQARRAVERLLSRETLDDSRRLGAVRLLARLSLKEEPTFDGLALVRSQEPKLPPALHADLYHNVATAAADESHWDAAVTLWIEALNRRLERAWLEQALHAADRAGAGPKLRGFFERQMERSPRDVRWAVAVREIRRHQRDVEGALSAARAAVEVRPERESLWRELADLLVRADRVGEAAEALAGWNEPRPADEHVAAWRGELYAHAGQGRKALDLERAALDAFDRRATEKDDDHRREARQRAARAARRLIGYGHPELAWELLSPKGGLSAIAGSALTDREQALLALKRERFIALLEHRLSDKDFRDQAANVLRSHGRPEDRAQAQAWIVDRVLPPGATREDAQALTLLWPFAGRADLESQVSVAFARRLLLPKTGPWLEDESLPFLASVGASIVDRRERIFRLRLPEVERLWLADLVRRDRPDLLLDFLRPSWVDLLERVDANTPLPSTTAPLAWTHWLNDGTVFAAWARAAGREPESVRAMAPLFEDRRRWDRFWTLAARDWDVAPLLEILPREARLAWFGHWAPHGNARDAALRARYDVTQRAIAALDALIAGLPGSAADPLIVKLRGPRTVGDVLGQDPLWLWPDLAARPDGSGDDRIAGQGVDAGRLPGALWGERPGDAWFVLEVLARLRENDPSAPLVIMEVPTRGGEKERARVAVDLAEALGEPSLATRLAERHLGVTDLAQLGSRLRLLVGEGRTDEAVALYRERVRRRQATLTVEELRDLHGMGDDLALGSPLEILDPDVPLAPALLAYLHDRRGPETADRFTTQDPVGFRAALAARWTERERELSARQLRAWIDLLWAHDAASLPRSGLRKLGGLWSAAADWLESQSIADRAAAVAAVAALPAANLPSALRRTPAEETTHLLQARIHLARGEHEAALDLVDRMLSELEDKKPLALESVPAAPWSGGDELGDDIGEDAWAGASDIEDALENDPVGRRLGAWLAPFREVDRVDLVRERFAEVLARQREIGRVPVASWSLALHLAASEEDRATLLAELDDAWLRGDWPSANLGELVDAMAGVLPAEAPRWIERWPALPDHTHVQRRARALARIKDPAAAARVLVDGARRGTWTASEEVDAFDNWRRLPIDAPDGPPGWTAALPFWRGKAGTIEDALGAHLASHPHDYRAARAALRAIEPAPEAPLRRALAAMDAPALSSRPEHDGDQRFIHARIARGLLPRSPVAASNALGHVQPHELARELVERRMRSTAIEGALADIATIASSSGDAAAYREALAELVDRQASTAAAARAHHAAQPAVKPRPFLTIDGRPAPYRPRDLGWPVIAGILATETTR